MELQLRLALPNNHDHHATGGEGSKPRKDANKKLGFDEGYGRINGDELQMKQQLLLLWSGQPNEDDDDDQKRHMKRDSSNINKNEDEEGKLIVGWPPIQTWRKNLLRQPQLH